MIKLLEIKSDAEAIFKSRPNKYVAEVDIVKPFSEKCVVVHIHDPGRLSEILYPGNTLLLKNEDKPHRKTKWDVIAGKVNNDFVLIHSGYHRKIAESVFEKNILPFCENFKTIKAEVKYKNHRIDFVGTEHDNKKCWIEVKGCTLGKGQVALFPDAPTVRGANHLKILLELQNKGDNAKLVILIFAPDVEYFMPNAETDKNFSEIFKYIVKKGIDVYPLSLLYENNWVYFKKQIDFKISNPL